MTALRQATTALHDIEALLLSSPQGTLDPELVAERVRAVRRLLSAEDVQWIGTTEAKRLLGLGSENTVKAWARTGSLRSRTAPNGRVQVLLDDVLHRRAEREGLMAIGGEELSAGERRSLIDERPGRNPWDKGRTETEPSP